MRYDEIKKMIIGSSPDDWAVVETGGGVFTDGLAGAGSGAEGRPEAESHVYLAVYRPAVELRLAWGLTTSTGLEFEGWDFAHQSIVRRLTDGFWQGALVARWSVLSVDEYRCFLPMPEPLVAATGLTPRDHEIAGWAVKASEVALARLLQGLTFGDDSGFDGYLEQTGSVVVPDEEMR